MFELPTGFDCIVPSDHGYTITAYTPTQRSTYQLIGFDWVETNRYYTTQSYSNVYCYTGPIMVPADVKVQFVLPAVIIVLCFFHVIMNMYMGVRRR